MRTDSTFVCTNCRVRTWPVRRCPSCGETRYLGDLEQRSLGELEASRPDREAPRLLPPLLGLGGVASAFAAAVSFGAGHVGMAEVGVVGALGGLVGAALTARRAPVDAARPYRLLGAPVVRASMSREIRRGKVRAQQTILSPLTRTPCVAWRLIGTAGAMPLDDGRAVPFTLLVGRDELEVDATIATLELEPDADARILSHDPELARWLAARGIDPSGELSVREAIAADGDELEVVGTVGIQARADGYRGHSSREVIADRPGSSLVIRRATPVVGEGRVTIA